jgi:hypothetical protein
MGKKSQPPPPDYTAAAEKTAQSNKDMAVDQTWANRANQTNPWGSVTWDAAKMVDPATGKDITQWTQDTKLDPRLQHALDSQIALQSGRSDLANSLFPRAQAEFGDAMDWSGLTSWGQGPQGGNVQTTTNPYGFGGGRIQSGLNFGGAPGVSSGADTRSRAEDAIYKQSASRLDPRFQQGQTDLETKLANQGITRGSDAYSRAMKDFDTAKNDAYSQAQMNAITGGGAEAQRDYGMDMGNRQQYVNEMGQQGQFANSAQQQRYQQMMGQQQQGFGQNLAAQGQNFQQGLQAATFQNTMRQQQLAEAMQQRGFSLNEINAIISGQQVSAPSFSGYNTQGATAGVDYSGAASAGFDAQMQQKAAKDAQTGQIMGAVGSVAGAAMMFSDERLKKDIAREGDDPRGFGLYRYRFVGEFGAFRHGVLAQEVARVVPDAVAANDEGVLRVDYSMLGLDGEAA